MRRQFPAGGTTGPQLAAGSLSLGGTSPVDYGSIIGLMDELAIYDLGSLTNSIQIEMALENIAAHYDLGSGTGALLIVK